MLEKLQAQFTGLANIVRQVVDQVEGLRRAFNGNHAAYSQALQAVDGHLAVMRSVINDIYLDKVTEKDGNIDWDTYYQWYNEFVEQERIRMNAQSKEEGRLISAAEADEIIFGGDYKSEEKEEEDVQACTSGSVEVQPGSEEQASSEDSGDQL